MGFCAKNRPKSVDLKRQDCWKTLVNIFRHIVYLKTNVMVKILQDHRILVLLSVKSNEKGNALSMLQRDSNHASEVRRADSQNKSHVYPH